MKRSAVMAAVLAATAAMAAGQVNRITGGRELDANYGIGTGGYNSTSRVYGPVSGNLIVNRQVTGLGFRGTVPYAPAGELRLTLPSAEMDTFLRRSQGLSEVTGAAPSYGLGAYLSPMRTVLSPAAIAAGYALPGSAMPRSAYVPSDRARELIDAAVEPYKPILAEVSRHRRINAALDPDVNAASTAGRTALRPTGLAATEAFRPTASTLFGMLTSKKQQELATELARADAALSNPALAAEARARVRARVEGRPAGADALAGKPAEGEPATGLPSAPEGSAEGPPPTEGLRAGQAGRQGEDVFLDILTQVKRIRQAEPDGPAPVRHRTPEKVLLPKDNSKKSEEEYEQEMARRSVERLRDQVYVHSLAGRSKDLFNHHMAEAEKRLKAGKFYAAADSYAVAAVLDPNNPLPQVGSTLAQFAANEPLSGALCLRHGMLHFPPLMEIRVDVDGMVGKKVVDRRIGVLEKRLADAGEKAEPSLVFLAMFIRHCRGDADLAKAHARTLQKLAGKDKVYQTYAKIVLTGEVPGAGRG